MRALILTLLITSPALAQCRKALFLVEDDAYKLCVKRNAEIAEANAAREREYLERVAMREADIRALAETKLADQAAAERVQREERERAERSAQYDANIAAIQAEERGRQAEIQRRCGKDAFRVRVGMTFKRVVECANDGFELVGQHGRASVYESSDGLVRVVDGRVTSWIANSR